MPDVFTKEKRSEIMSLIRAKNTGIEKKVFAFLRRENIYFQKHYSKVAGSPDVALPKKKVAIFIDGDFWHGYKFQQWKQRIPQEYWRSKIEGNIARDIKNRRALRRKGWKVLRIWGHNLAKNPETTLSKIAAFLRS